MNNVVYGKTMENLRKRIDVRPVSNEIYCLKWIIKAKLYVKQNFGNALGAIRKKRATLILNKSPHAGM